MGQVDEDNLTEFGRGLFTSLSPTVASSSLLGNRLKAVRKLQLVNTVMDGLAVGRTLKHGAFAATTVHVNPIYAITLLGPVSRPVRFIGWAGVGGPVEDRELEVLPDGCGQTERPRVTFVSVLSLFIKCKEKE